MAERTPLFQQECNVSHYNATTQTEEHAAEYEIPVMEIVNALLLEWLRNGANEDLTQEEIMAMHLQYRRITGGRPVFHAQHVIMNELADGMLRWRLQTGLFTDDLQARGLRHRILRNLRESWPSIIHFDENIAQNLNTYNPPACRERIQNSWISCQRKCNAFERFLSHFACQILLCLILLGWPLSLLTMGAMFMLQCPTDSFLPNAIILIGLLGIVTLKGRLVLAFIEKWCWFSMRTRITCLWYTLKFLEFTFLLVVTIQLWFFSEYSTIYDSGNFYFCNKTFYSFIFWMKWISTAFALVWLLTFSVKAICWLVRRIRYHYMPVFELEES